MKKMKLLTGISFLIAVSAMTPVKAVSYSEFRDLPEYAWYEGAVASALEQGILDGVDGNTFAPDEPIRSIDTAKAFYRMAGEPYWIDASYFSDVSAGTDSLAASYCIDTGIMSGYHDGTFRPDEWISRLDLLIMMYGWSIADHRADFENPSADGQIEQSPESADNEQAAEESLPETITEKETAPAENTQETVQPSADDMQSEQTEPASENEPESQPAEEPVQDLSSRALAWAKRNGFYDERESFMLLDPVTRAQACDLLTRALSLPRVEQSTDEAADDGNTQSVQTEEPTAEEENKSWTDRLFGWLNPDVNDDPVTPGTGSEEDLANASMYGIDISEHQGDIDLSPYQGQFVIIRAGWHTTEDLYFRQNVQKCEELGIPYGLYWYSYALDESQAVNEAEAFARAIEGLNPQMGVWIDMETDSWKSEHGFEVSTENISAITRTITSRIEQTGLKPGIYCNSRWLRYFDESLSSYPRWVAAYGNDDGNIHADYSDQAMILQYTSNPIDKNVLYRQQ